MLDTFVEDTGADIFEGNIGADSFVEGASVENSTVEGLVDIGASDEVIATVWNVCGTAGAGGL